MPRVTVEGASNELNPIYYGTIVLAPQPVEPEPEKVTPLVRRKKNVKE